MALEVSGVPEDGPEALLLGLVFCFLVLVTATVEEVVC